MNNNLLPPYSASIGWPRKFQNARLLKRLPRRPNERLSDQSAPQAQRARNRDAIELLETWIAEDAAMAPTQQQAALAEWDHLQQLLDEEALADAPLRP